MLKLPKDIQTHKNLGTLEAYFADSEAPLKPGSAAKVSAVSFDEALEAALKVVAGTGHLIQGLEQITKTLDKEKKGIDAARAKSGQAAGRRLSRLLFVAGDGAERFYRDVEALLGRHADWVWCCLLDVDAGRLGAVLSPKGKPAKAFLIDDRKALGLFLSQLGDRLG